MLRASAKIASSLVCGVVPLQNLHIAGLTHLWEQRVCGFRGSTAVYPDHRRDGTGRRARPLHGLGYPQRDRIELAALTEPTRAGLDREFSVPIYGLLPRLLLSDSATAPGAEVKAG